MARHAKIAGSEFMPELYMLITGRPARMRLTSGEWLGRCRVYQDTAHGTIALS